jgi:DNA-directed RNA polymerase omega subunit
MSALKTSIEKVDIDRALENFGHNQYELVLASAKRARDIATERLLLDKNARHERRDSKPKEYTSTPVVQALTEAAAGLYNRDYLIKNTGE